MRRPGTNPRPHHQDSHQTHDREGHASSGVNARALVNIGSNRWDWCVATQANWNCLAALSAEYVYSSAWLTTINAEHPVRICIPIPIVGHSTLKLHERRDLSAVALRIAG
jgi:hypothetical protein